MATYLLLIRSEGKGYQDGLASWQEARGAVSHATGAQAQINRDRPMHNGGKGNMENTYSGIGVTQIIMDTRRAHLSQLPNGAPAWAAPNPCVGWTCAPSVHRLYNVP